MAGIEVRGLAAFVAAAAALAACDSAPPDGEPRAATSPPSAASSPSAAGADTAGGVFEQLRAGGYTVFIRHAEAGASEAEGDPDECGGPERSLDDLGRRQVADIAAGIEALQLPVVSVVTSRACRTLVTADAVLDGIAGRPATVQDEGVAEGDELRELLETPVPSGGNALVVGHSSPFEDATGLSSGARGTTVVLSQRDGRLVEVARLTPAQWREYAETAS